MDLTNHGLDRDIEARLQVISEFLADGQPLPFFFSGVLSTAFLPASGFSLLKLPN